jgi:hypothetical protein
MCFVTFPALFVCICVLNNCHRVATQLQLNISYQSALPVSYIHIAIVTLLEGYDSEDDGPTILSDFGKNSPVQRLTNFLSIYEPFQDYGHQKRTWKKFHSEDTRIWETTGPKWFVHAISHPEFMHPCLIPEDTRLLETTDPKWFVHAIRRQEFMHPCPIRLGVKSQSLYLRSDCCYLHFVGTGTVNLRIAENSAFPHFSASSITVTFSSDLYSPTVCYYVQQEPIRIA